MKPFAVAAAVLLWAATIVRIRMLAGSMAQRLLWVALLAVAIALTLDVPRVAHAVDGVPGVGANISHLGKHVLAVVAAGAIHEVVRVLVLPPATAQRGRRRGAVLTATAALLLSVTFALAPVHDQPVPGLTYAAAGEPLLLAYWAIYLLAVGTAVVNIALTARYAVKTFPAGPLRTGMRWMGAGAVVGLLYCAHKIFSLIAATASGGAWPRAETTDRVQTILVPATLTIVAAGFLWPTAGRWPLVKHLTAYRAYRRLYPLWRAYHEAEPSIAFPSPAAGRPAWLQFREVELRLYRRVIEIRDGMLAVRPYAHPDSRKLALQEAETAGIDEAFLVGEAAWLELARRAKLRGDPPHANHVPATSGAPDVAGETRTLTRIASAHQAIEAIADRVEHTTAARTATP